MAQSGVLYHLLPLILTYPVLCVDFHDFDPYQYQLTQKQVECTIRSSLEKDPSIAAFYHLSPEALYIGPKENLDYVLYLCEDPQAKQQLLPHSLTLAGAKIALDPGHFGGEFAELEDRCVIIEETQSAPIRLHEGDLSYLTALVLKTLLEAEGAEVLITRPGIGQGAIQEPFFTWLSKRPALQDTSLSLSQIFRRYYNRDDLRARALLINAFQPDLTLILHYNAHLREIEKQQNKSLTENNYNLMFIPGAFCKHELDQVEDRYEFLRLIVTQDLEKSLKLSEHVLAAMTEKLEVPPVTEEELSPYMDQVILLQRRGIYSRNLALTRLIHGPVCYGETLIQNNVKEVYRLSKHETDINGYPCSKRVQQVAEAYFQGIKDYFNDL